MPKRSIDFSVFDADNHMYEGKDAFTRYLPKAYQGAIRYVEIDGRTKIAINGLISDYIPNPTFEVVARPGAEEEYYRNGNPQGKSKREIFGKPMRCPEWARNAEARLPHLRELGIDRTLLFPTLGSLLEERMREQPELVHEVVHAFNQWIHDEWQFNYRDTIFGTPVITLPIVEKAVEELEWCLERGARCVLVRPAPAWGIRGPRSPGLPEFDPFWSLVQESGVLVGVHSSDSGYAELGNLWAAGDSEFLPFKDDPLRAIIKGKRDISDFMAALVCDGALVRHPNAHVAAVETGSEWVVPLFKQFAKAYRMTPQAFEEDPIETFKRNVWISPFFEDDLAELIDVLGADKVLFGSDYPHPEGLANPLSYIDDLPEDLPTEDVAKIMGGNLAGLMGVAA